MKIGRLLSLFSVPSVNQRKRRGSGALIVSVTTFSAQRVRIGGKEGRKERAGAKRPGRGAL